MFEKIIVNNALEEEMQPDNTSITSIDAYVGCQIQCPYCFQMSNKEWGKKIYIRTNIAQMLEIQLNNKGNKDDLYIGSLSDPYMDVEKDYQLTKSILEVLKDREHKLYITTKSVNRLILRDLELLKSFKVKPTILLGLSHMEQAIMGDNHINIQVANELYAAGVDVWIFIAPILPHIMNIDEMIEAINPDIHIYMDKLRVFTEGKQADKIYEFVRIKYPKYLEQYRRILFEEDESYYSELVEKYRDDERITFMFELWGK